MQPGGAPTTVASYGEVDDIGIIKYTLEQTCHMIMFIFLPSSASPKLIRLPTIIIAKLSPVASSIKLIQLRIKNSEKFEAKQTTRK